MEAAINAQNLASALQYSFSPDANQRTEAEGYLQHASSTHGITKLYLELVCSGGVDTHVLQAGAIQLKNIVRARWNSDNRFPAGVEPLVDEEKALVRSHLAKAMIMSSASIRSQLVACFSTIIYNDYPTVWNTLPEEIETLYLQGVAASDMNIIHVALLMARSVFSRVEHSSHREQHDILVARVMPKLLELSLQLVTSKRAFESEECANLLNLCLKSYWSSAYLSLFSTLSEPAVLDGWMEVCERVICTPIESRFLSDCSESMEKQKFSKARKWALRIVQRFYERYGDTTNNRKSADHNLAKYLLNKWIPRLLTAELQVLSFQLQGNAPWLSNRHLVYILKFLTIAIRQASIYNQIKGDLLSIIYKVAFPAVKLSVEEKERWFSDPAGYVTMDRSMSLSGIDLKSSAIEFIVKCCQERSQLTLVPVLQFVTGEVQKAKNSLEGEGIDHAYAALHVLSALAGSFTQKLKQVPLEQFVETDIVPLLRHPNCFIRFRSATVFENLLPVYKKRDISNALLQQIYNGLLDRMQDRELPVAVACGSAIGHLLRLKQSKAIIESTAAELVNRCLTVMIQSDDEGLVQALQRLVDKYTYAVLPLAHQVMTRLSISLSRLLEKESEEVDDSLSTTLNIDQVIATIKSIVNASINDSNIFQQMSSSLLQIVFQLVDPKLYDFIDDGLEIASHLACMTPTYTKEIWMIVDHIYGMICSTEGNGENDGWATEYCSNIQVLLSFFITRDPETLCYGISSKLNRPYKTMLLDIITSCIKHALNVIDIQQAVLIAIMMIEASITANNGSMKGTLDDVVQNIFILTLKWNYQMKKEREKYTSPREKVPIRLQLLCNGSRAALVHLWSTCIFYNPALIIQNVLNTNTSVDLSSPIYPAQPSVSAAAMTENLSEVFLTLFSENLAFLTSPEQKRSVILCCTGIIGSIANGSLQLNPLWNHAFPTLLTQLNGMIQDTVKERKKNVEAAMKSRNEESNDEDNDESDYEDEDWQNEDVDEGADVFRPSELTYLNKLADFDMDGEDFDDDEDFDCDEDSYESPFDNLDPVKLMVQSIHALGDVNARGDIVNRIGGEAFISEMLQQETQISAQEQILANQEKN